MTRNEAIRFRFSLVTVTILIGLNAFGARELFASSPAQFLACIESSQSGQTCVLPASATVVADQVINVGAPRMTILCAPGAKLVKGADGALLVIGQNDVHISGCEFDGASSRYKGSVVVIKGASGVTLDQVEIENTTNSAIHISDSTDVTVENSRILNTASDGIYVDGNSSNIQITKNAIDATTSKTWHHAIGAHSTNPGKRISHLTITGNQIRNGISFCVEVGAFGGEPPIGVTVDHNICEQALVTSSCGGYSFDTVDGLNLASNQYLNRTGTRGRLAGIELVSGKNAKAIDNELYDAGISINKQSYSVVDHNTLTFATSISRRSAAIYLGGSKPVDNSHDTVENNVVQFLPGAGQMLGIMVQCNATGINCSKLQLLNNTLTGNRAQDGVAIRIENDFPRQGPPVDINVSGNQLSGWSTCYALSDLGVNAQMQGNKEGCSRH